ncbi:response regulator transcription factor [Salmonella enterica]|nr:response regulator transcription factor [Salmonella enterica]
MISVLIKDNDDFYRHCMQEFIQEVIQSELKRNVRFIRRLSECSVSRADLVIVTLDTADMYSCLQTLKGGRYGRLIGLVRKHVFTEGGGKLLSQCARNIRILSRQSSLAGLREVILEALRNPRGLKTVACERCPVLTRDILSPQQTRIIAEMFEGRPIKEIADGLKVSTSTVYSHKYILMKKFNLKNNHDLFRFWTEMKLAENTCRI